MPLALALFIAPFLGAFMIYGGIHELTTNDVSCGGSTMTQSQECVHYSTHSGSSSTNDYAAEQRSNRTTGIVLLLAGVPIFAIGIWFIRALFAEFRKKKARPGPVPPGSPSQ